MTLTNNRVVKYLFEAKEELQKVTWPTRKEVYRYTLLVIALTLGLALYFGVIDWAMQLGLEKLLEVSTASSAPAGTISDVQPEIMVDPNSIEIETSPTGTEGTTTTIVE